jgi:hypothetical protein
MQERYGMDRRPVGRWIGVTALTLAFVAVLAYVTVGLTRNSVESRLLSWKDVGADRVDVAFEVRRSADDDVTCVVRAQDEDRVDVGYASVAIPPGDERVRVDYSLRTLAPAYAVELLGCTAGRPPSVPPPQFPPGVVPPDQPYQP